VLGDSQSWYLANTAGRGGVEFDDLVLEADRSIRAAVASGDVNGVEFRACVKALMTIELILVYANYRGLSADDYGTILTFDGDSPASMRMWRSILSVARGEPLPTDPEASLVPRFIH
jgi:hypothetical protein